jgi:hypothetical protein
MKKGLRELKWISQPMQRAPRASLKTVSKKPSRSELLEEPIPLRALREAYTEVAVALYLSKYPLCDDAASIIEF